MEVRSVVVGFCADRRNGDRSRISPAGRWDLPWATYTGDSATAQSMLTAVSCCCLSTFGLNEIIHFSLSIYYIALSS
jgi:hypothetical protein